MPNPAKTRTTDGGVAGEEKKVQGTGESEDLLRHPRGVNLMFTRVLMHRNGGCSILQQLKGKEVIPHNTRNRHQAKLVSYTDREEKTKLHQHVLLNSRTESKRVHSIRDKSRSSSLGLSVCLLFFPTVHRGLAMSKHTQHQ